MGKEKDKVQALLSLLGDPNPKIAATARRQLLELDPSISEKIEHQLSQLNFKQRIRARQVVAWLETKPRTWELPAFVPQFSYRRVKET